MKSTIIALLLAGCLAGCASDRPVVTPMTQMPRVRMDCTNADIQINWLNNNLQNSGYDPNRSDAERQYVAQAKEMIWNLRSQCLRSVTSLKQFPQ